MFIVDGLIVLDKLSFEEIVYPFGILSGTFGLLTVVREQSRYVLSCRTSSGALSGRLVHLVGRGWWQRPKRAVGSRRSISVVLNQPSSFV